MTRSAFKDSNGHRMRVRTLGLPASSERALMGRAYENYATAQRLHTDAHNAWRATQRMAHKSSRVTAADIAKALSKATEAGLYLADAKAQYHRARALAEQVAA